MWCGTKEQPDKPFVLATQLIDGANRQVYQVDYERDRRYCQIANMTLVMFTVY